MSLYGADRGVELGSQGAGLPLLLPTISLFYYSISELFAKAI